MSTIDQLNDRFSIAQANLEKYGQAHLLQFWEQLNAAERGNLLDQIESIQWELVERLIGKYLKADTVSGPPSPLSAPTAYSKVNMERDQSAEFQSAKARGEQLLREGKVAAFTVAGGQGTRLGFDGPKGAMPISPVRNKPFFQMFAEKILATGQAYGKLPGWYIMTSAANHQQTVDFFLKHQYFGLPESDVFFFSQAMLPSFGTDGKVLLSDKSNLAMSPDGHGGALKAIYDHGALATMQQRGVEIISYFQVDNPLVRPFDPLFLGLHAITGSDMSTKVTAKTSDTEKVGNLCLHNDRLIVVEYSDFPEELARSKNADGSRKFNYGNLGIHALSVNFVARIVGEQLDLPHHRALKAVPFVDASGHKQTPTAPNGIKLEKFIFDALPMASHPMLLEVDRNDEFAPVKNASGSDSPETSIRAQIARDARWLESRGVFVPYASDGHPNATIEISESLLAQENPQLPKAIMPNELIYLG